MNVRPEDLKEWSPERYLEIKKMYNNMTMRQLQIKNKTLHDKLVKLRTIEEIKLLKPYYERYQDMLTSKVFVKKNSLELLSIRNQAEKMGIRINTMYDLLSDILVNKSYKNYMVDYKTLVERIEERRLIQEKLEITKETYAKEINMDMLNEKEILNLYKLNKLMNKSYLEGTIYSDIDIKYAPIKNIKELYKSSGWCLEDLQRIKQKKDYELTDKDKERLGVEKIVKKAFELSDLVVKSISVTENINLPRGEPELQLKLDITNEIEL